MEIKAHFDQVKRSVVYAKYPRQKGMGGRSNGLGDVEGIVYVDLSEIENAILDAQEAAWPPLIPKNVTTHGYPYTDIAKLIDHIVLLEEKVALLEKRLSDDK